MAAQELGIVIGFDKDEIGVEKAIANAGIVEEVGADDDLALIRPAAVVDDKADVGAFRRVGNVHRFNREIAKRKARSLELAHDGLPEPFLNIESIVDMATHVLMGVNADTVASERAQGSVADVIGVGVRNEYGINLIAAAELLLDESIAIALGADAAVDEQRRAVGAQQQAIAAAAGSDGLENK